MYKQHEHNMSNNSMENTQQIENGFYMYHEESTLDGDISKINHGLHEEGNQ